jgi:hypothetical protein
LKDKYALAEDTEPKNGYKPLRPTAFSQGEKAPVLAPAVMQSTIHRPHLMNVLALADCKRGGFLVETDVAASIP